MALNRTNQVLLAALLLSLGLHVVLRPQPSRRNPAWPLSNMGRSPAAKPYQASNVLPQGAELQSPPPGTVPYGETPLHYAATPADAARAGRELTSPLKPGDPAALARGEMVYRTYCLPCHGATGKGDGLVAQRGFPPPPDLAGDKTKALPDGQLFHIITYGQKNMPPYAAQIPVIDRWKVVVFVRKLQGATP